MIENFYNIRHYLKENILLDISRLAISEVYTNKNNIMETLKPGKKIALQTIRFETLLLLFLFFFWLIMRFGYCFFPDNEILDITFRSVRTDCWFLVKGHTTITNSNARLTITKTLENTTLL